MQPCPPSPEESGPVSPRALALAVLNHSPLQDRSRSARCTLSGSEREQNNCNSYATSTSLPQCQSSLDRGCAAPSCFLFAMFPGRPSEAATLCNVICAKPLTDLRAEALHSLLNNGQVHFFPPNVCGAFSTSASRSSSWILVLF